MNRSSSHALPLLLALCTPMFGVACIGADSSSDHTGRSDSRLIGGVQDLDHDSASVIYYGANSSCTAARVSPRQLLTAAHCVQGTNSNNLGTGVVDPAFAAGQFITVSRDTVQDGSATYDPYAIESTVINPGWTAACSVAGCVNNQSLQPTFTSDLSGSGLLPGFAPDVAIITLQSPLPASFPTAIVDLQPVPAGTSVTVVGYGCEVSVGGAAPAPARYKVNYESVLDVSAVNTPSQNVLPDALATFNSSYIVTPGNDQDSIQAASLCPGDSGGPLYRHEWPNTNKVIGVNAYYTFQNAGGISYNNLHTRLGNGDLPYFVTGWLVSNLIDATILQ